MSEHLRSPGKPPPLALPLVVRPPFRKDAATLIGRHSPEEIIDTVFRVLCGYESVSEACLRKGIKPDEYYHWHENFVEICRKWSPQRFRLGQIGPADGPERPTLTSGGGSASTGGAGETGLVLTDDEFFVMAGARLPEDIARRAQHRLSVAWRADYQSLRLVGR